MDKKMTSGEIAKKAGISQKAVRLYDEKGLLKPSDYSEGNYRLYDKEALLVLEKIIALKQIGFSLEEIHDNLITEKNMNITESLNRQLEIMEKKKAEIERTIGCIKNMLIRTNGQPDWDSVAELACMIQKDQGADERHFHALKHTAENTDWYVKIYNTLELKENANVLDLGCGFAKLWRNNWSDIPKGIKVDAVDLHGSWADDFEKYINENNASLSEGSDISIKWGDIEGEDTWKDLGENAFYEYVIAHYLWSFIKEKELFVQRVVSVLADGGMFSCNGYEVSREHMFWKKLFDEMKLNSGFISEKFDNKQKKRDEFKDLLEKYFGTVEAITISNNMRYENGDEAFERLCTAYQESKKYLIENEKKIKEYLNNVIMEKGEMIVEADSEFWHCYK